MNELTQANVQLEQKQKRPMGSGYALAGMILGICGLIGMLTLRYLGDMAAVIALVYSIMALRKKLGSPYVGMAIAGLVMGILVVLISIASMVLLIIYPYAFI